MECLDQKEIFIKKESIKDLLKDIKISWVNLNITDSNYPFKDDFLGKWQIQVLRINKKTKFEDIVKLCKQDNYKPATIYHLLNFIKENTNLYNYKSLMAPGSFHMDDFEHVGCVVLMKDSDKDLSLGMGNWRGFKIGGYDVLRVKKLASS